MTVWTRVCWSITSLTQMAYGSFVLLQGRSRCSRAYQASRASWSVGIRRAKSFGRSDCARPGPCACCLRVRPGVLARETGRTESWEAFDMGTSSTGLSKAGTAAVLSFVVPGLGQFYNGKFWRGIFWLIVTPGLWGGGAGWLGWICHVLSACTAYQWAKKR